MSDRPTLQFTSPEVPQPEPAGRRRRWLAPLITALAVLVLTLPVAVFLLLRDGEDRAEPGAPSTSTSRSPDTTPSTAPTSPAAPDGHIPLAVLGDATLDVPAWPTDHVRGPSGRLRFHDGVVELDERATPSRTPPYGREIAILSVAYGDVDRDGSDETIAELGCLIEGGSKQLVAFDRDSTGRIVTIGTVIATTGEIRDIRDGSTRVTDDGTVTVDLGDYQRCCDDQTPQKWQRRGYRLADDRFSQITGPTRMPVNPYVTENTVTAGRLVLSPATDGYRYGTVDVTVRHVRGARPNQVVVRFVTPAGLEPAGAGWPPITRDAVSVSVTVDAPPAHGTVTRTYAFRQPLTGTGANLDIEILARSDRVGTLSDTMPWDDTITVPVRVVS
jgi:hypothetical protein